jgi:hypothetical protein
MAFGEWCIRDTISTRAERKIREAVARGDDLAGASVR